MMLLFSSCARDKKIVGDNKHKGISTNVQHNDTLTNGLQSIWLLEFPAALTAGLNFLLLFYYFSFREF